MPRPRKPQRRRRSASGRSSAGQSGSAPSTSRGLQGPVKLGGRRTRRWLFLIAAGTFAVLIIAGFSLPQIFDLLPGRGTGTDEYNANVGQRQEIMTFEQATIIGGNTYPAGEEDARHLDAAYPDWPEYNTVPPTSGPHLSIESHCGFFGLDFLDPDTGETRVLDQNLVHNLEHGQVVISYNLPNQEDVDRLNDLHRDLLDNELWLITRPYHRIPEGQVAMTAWGVLDQFTGVDEGRIRAFYDEYKGNRFSAETSQAGRGIVCRGSPQAMESSTN